MRLARRFRAHAAHDGDGDDDGGRAWDSLVPQLDRYRQTAHHAAHDGDGDDAYGALQLVVQSQMHWEVLPMA